MSPLLTHYFTDAKILETWALCEQHGVNTMILFPADKRAAGLYERYRASGGRIQYLAQISPGKEDLKTPAKQARDAGAVGAFLLGNLSDAWTREGDVNLIGELLACIKDQGLISGVAGHELRTVMAVEKAGFAPDFYMKTLHQENYWSKRQPDQKKEVIDNYAIDNYWCLDPKETIAYMSELRRPWIAYKVLAAGAIQPQSGLQHAFQNGADFAAVGMFDFQIGENVALTNQVVAAAQSREREWFRLMRRGDLGREPPSFQSSRSCYYRRPSVFLFLQTTLPILGHFRGERRAFWITANASLRQLAWLWP